MQSNKRLGVATNWVRSLLGAFLLLACIGEPATVSIAGWVVELPREDRQVILNLLRTRQFARLNQRYDDLQQQYESGLINDRDLTLQYQAFYDTSPENETYLNQWVEKSPKSYPARLARGIYYAKVGVERRGSEFLRDTPREKLNELSRYLDLANRDAVDSLPLTAKPIVSLLQLLKSSQHRDGMQANRMWLDYANRIDPTNYVVRRRFMITLTPRWGGSYDEMWAFLKECQNQHLPPESLKVFEARIYLDQAQVLCCEQHQPEQGLILYRKVVALLEGIDVPEKVDALKGIVRHRNKSQSLVDVAPEIEAILRIAPTDSTILGYRGWIRFQQRRFEEGFEDYSIAAELGDAYSQLQLGQRLYFGMPPTVVPNQEQGLSWIRKAADQGNEAARKFLVQAGEKK